MTGPVVPDDHEYCFMGFERLENEISVQTELTMADMARLEVADNARKRERETGKGIYNGVASEGLHTTDNDLKAERFEESPIKIYDVRSIRQDEHSSTEEEVKNGRKHNNETMEVDHGSRYGIGTDCQQEGRSSEEVLSTNSGGYAVIGCECEVMTESIISELAVASDYDHDPVADHIQFTSKEEDNGNNHSHVFQLRVSHNRVLSGCFECDTLSATFKRLTENFMKHYVKTADMGEDKEDMETDSDESIHTVNETIGNKMVQRKPYGCSLCEKGFATVEGLSYHLGEHDVKSPSVGEIESDEEVKPEECYDGIENEERADTRGSLSEASGEESDENEGSGGGDMCTEEVKNESKDAVKNVSSTLRNMIGCGLCDQGFESFTQLEFHLFQKHSNDEPLKCPVCKKESFSNVDALKAHQKTHQIHKATVLTRHPCRLCGKVFGRKADRDRHLKTHENRRKPKKLEEIACQLCEKVFKNKGLHSVHMLRVHNVQPYKCEICSESFNSKHEIDCHNRDKHAKPKTYHCTVCKLSFSTVSFLTDHFKEHLQPLPHPDIFCDVCSKIFPHKGLLLHHKNTMHKEKKSYKCETCGKVYSDKMKFEWHLNLHAEKFKCNVCDKAFVSQGFLDHHMNMHNANHSCSICKRAFVNYKNLAIHEKSHHGENQYKCTLCDKSYAYKAHLHNHFKSNHKPRKPPVYHSCTICGKQYRKKSLLKYHMNMHSNVRPFLCAICGKAMKRKNALQLHMMTHASNSEKHHQCDKCGKRFGHKRFLLLHQKVHNEREFECDKCEKRFSNLKYLRKHEETHKDKRCDECGETFVSWNSIRAHKKKAHPEKKPLKIVCSICNENFTNFDMLIDHCNTQHSDSTVEVQQAVNILLVNDLSNTEHSISTEKIDGMDSPQVLVTCSYCDQTFTDITLLTDHCNKQHMVSSPAIQKKTKRKGKQNPDNGPSAKKKTLTNKPIQPVDSNEDLIFKSLKSIWDTINLTDVEVMTEDQ